MYDTIDQNRIFSNIIAYLPEKKKFKEYKNQHATSITCLFLERRKSFHSIVNNNA